MFFAIFRERLLESSPYRELENPIAATLAGSLTSFLWGCKRPQSMPATYAPGPRCNDSKYKTVIWACQGLNTTYLAYWGLQAQHMGALPVDIPGEELGTGWVIAGGKWAKPAY